MTKKTEAQKVTKKKGTSKTRVKSEQKATKKKGHTNGSDNELDNSEDDHPEDKTDIDWTPAMSAALLSAITDDPDIKQGLFPSPGANPRTGGKTKAAYHWALCVNLFQEHPDYKIAFSRAATAKQKGTWANKIKNRIKRMSEITRKYMDEMGETGAGITREDEINMDVKNAFTTKWGIIKEACPWFFEMRELIAERPNQVPVGLGHSQTDFDMSVMMADISEPTSNGGFTSDDMGNEILLDFEVPEGGSGINKLEYDDALSVDWDTAGLADTDDALSKRKAPATEGRPDKSIFTAKSEHRGGTSKPATRPLKNPAKRQKKDEFAEIAQAEEITRQKELDLAKARIEKDTTRAKAKLAKIELQKEKLAYARERRREKMRTHLTTMEGTSRQHGLHFSHSPMQSTPSSPSHSGNLMPIFPENAATGSQSFDPSSVIFPPHDFSTV